MKPFRWNAEKNEALKVERNMSFERIVVAIEPGELLDILAHPNHAKYPRQRALEEGIPYQTLIASVLHKYVTGRLADVPGSTAKQNKPPSKRRAA